MCIVSYQRYNIDILPSPSKKKKIIMVSFTHLVKTVPQFLSVVLSKSVKNNPDDVIRVV